MPISNLNVNHVPQADRTEVLTMLSTLKEKILALCEGVNLGPDERTRFARIRNRRIPFIRRVAEYRETSPELSAPHVNWTEHSADLSDFEFFMAIERELNIILRPAVDRLILAGNDVYQHAAADYKYTIVLAENSDQPGFSAKREDLKVYFPSTRNEEAEDEEAPNDDNAS